MKCFRAYHKQNTTSKSIVWKPYHEDKAKREKTEAKYLKTMIAVDQWKFAEKAGDTADKTIQNPYVKEQPQENAEELSEDEYTEETIQAVVKPEEKKVEVVEKPEEKKVEVVVKPEEKKVEVVFRFFNDFNLFLFRFYNDFNLFLRRNNR